jgi:hypothetical protein
VRRVDLSKLTGGTVRLLLRGTRRCRGRVRTVRFRFEEDLKPFIEVASTALVGVPYLVECKVGPDGAEKVAETGIVQVRLGRRSDSTTVLLSRIGRLLRMLWILLLRMRREMLLSLLKRGSS